MKTIFVLFAITFVMTSAVQIKGKHGIMAVLTEIEAKLKAKGPLEAIFRLIDQYSDVIRAEQSAHDTLFASQSAECDSEAAYRTKEVEEATAALSDAQNTLSTCNEQLQRANGDIASVSSEISANTNFNYLIDQARAREQEEFEKEGIAYQANKAAVQESIDILMSIW
jgi:hypothetical protein